MKNLFTLFLVSIALHGYTQLEIPGCTIPGAWNFNPAATIDDESCCFNTYLTIEPANAAFVLFAGDSYFADYGNGNYCLSEGYCYIMLTYEYFGIVTISLGNGAVFEIDVDSIEGDLEFSLGDEIQLYCNDVNACNYVPSSYEYGWNHHCTYECQGCTNPLAFNYDATATIDDGSCCTDSNNLIQITSDNPNCTLYISDEDQYTTTLTNFVNETRCINGSCYRVRSSNSSSQPVTYTFTNAENEIFHTITVETPGDSIFQISNGGIVGCMYNGALNYNPEATCSDYNSCLYVINGGCTDPSYINYNPDALFDDGSCCTEDHLLFFTCDLPYVAETYGYMGENFYYYREANDTLMLCSASGCMHLDVQLDDSVDFWSQANFQITDSEGNILYYNYGYSFYTTLLTADEMQTCNDFHACNYTPPIDCYNSSTAYCTYDCIGCTDPEATNFSPSAIYDNGTCCYGEFHVVSDPNSSIQIYPSFTDSNLNAVFTPLEDGYFCLPEGCISVRMFVYPASEVTLFGEDGIELFSAVVSDTLFYLSNNTIIGCLDDEACNYDPEANCSLEDLCDYSCIGCGFQGAENYNPDATVNSLDCCYHNYFRVETSAPATIEVMNLTQGMITSLDYENGWCGYDDCFKITISSDNSQPIFYSITDYDGNVFTEGTSNQIGNATAYLNPQESFVCNNPMACNYSTGEGCVLEEFCDFSCYGCTDPDAPNYDSEATVSTNSCCYDDWFRLELSDDAYFQVINNDYLHFENGHYPIQTGFCTTLNCFHLDVWSYNGVQLTYTIYNPENEIIATGVSTAAGQIAIDLSRNVGETAGCTVPWSCDYDPSSDCSSGYCLDCIGCTDELALNYSPSATVDDQSCFYDIAQPVIQESVLFNEDQSSFVVRLDFNELGNMQPFLVSTNMDDVSGILVNEVGTRFLGPFSCDANVLITIASIAQFNQSYEESLLVEGGCVVDNVEDAKESALDMKFVPNPASAQVMVESSFAVGDRLEIMDLSGQLVKRKTINQSCKQLQLETSDMASGIYVVHHRNENGSAQVGRLVITR